jgi:hypothetical protein
VYRTSSAFLDKATQLQRRVGEADANQIQVRVELQADCFAGLWVNRSQANLKFLEEDDVDAALQTASAIGDDTLQRRSQGYVVPDVFTHGSFAQRKRNASLAPILLTCSRPKYSKELAASPFPMVRHDGCRNSAITASIFRAQQGAGELRVLGIAFGRCKDRRGVLKRSFPSCHPIYNQGGIACSTL